MLSSNSIPLVLFPLRGLAARFPTSVYCCPERAKPREAGRELANKIASQSSGKAECAVCFSDTHISTDAHTHSQQQTAATSASLCLWLSEQSPLPLTCSVVNASACHPVLFSAACHRGDLASATMATSQQDSGFFDISLRSLLKSLGGSEYSWQITVVVI